MHGNTNHEPTGKIGSKYQELPEPANYNEPEPEEQHESYTNDYFERTGVGEWTWHNAQWRDRHLFRRADVTNAFWGEYDPDPQDS